MARTKQTARRSTGGNAPRKQLPTLSAEEAAERAAVDEAARAAVGGFVISGLRGYAAHMNGTFLPRYADRHQTRPDYRCVENPRLSMTFMRPSTHPISSYLSRLFLHSGVELDEEQRAQLQAHADFSGWVAQWTHGRGYRRGYLRSSDAGAAHPTEAAPESWQVVCGDGENPLSCGTWDAWDTDGEKCIAFEPAATISVLPASKSEVAAALQRRREHNIKVEAVLAKPAPIVLRGGELFGCRKTIWYPSDASKEGKEDDWDRSDRWQEDDRVEEKEEARKEAREKREKRAREEVAAAHVARLQVLRELAAQAAPKSSAPGSVWESGIKAVMAQVHPDVAIDAGGVALVDELVTRACDAIVDAATRELARPEAGPTRLPSFIESAFCTKVAYESWAREFAAIVAAEAEGDADDPPAMVDALAVLERATDLVLAEEGLVKYAKAEGRKGAEPTKPGQRLIFCPDVMGRRLATAPAALRTTAATRYLTGVVEYLAAELLELSGNAARDDAFGRRRWKGVDYDERALDLALEASHLRTVVED